MAFGGAAIRIDWEGDRASQIVDFVFGLMPTSAGRRIDGTFNFQSNGGDPLEVFRDERRLCSRQPDGFAAAIAMDQASELFTRASRGGLLLHAAAFIRHGKGIVVPAPSTAGKTTLAAWLSAGEFRCVTDECVYVPHRRRDLHALARPLRVRRGSWTILAQRFAAWPATSRVLDAPDSVMIPIDALNRSRRRAKAKIDLFLFARYDPHGTGEVSRLTPAHAAMRLLGSVQNAGNVAARGVREAARLARTIPAWEMKYRDCGQVEHALMKGPLAHVWH